MKRSIFRILSPVAALLPASMIHVQNGSLKVTSFPSGAKALATPISNASALADWSRETRISSVDYFFTRCRLGRSRPYLNLERQAEMGYTKCNPVVLHHQCPHPIKAT